MHVEEPITRRPRVTPGESSIAAFVKSSTNVTLSRVKLEAGVGQNGQNGVLVPFTMPSAAELEGNGATGGTGGGPRMYNCPDGAQTTGGAGGIAPNQGGGPGAPALGAGQGGVAGTPTDCGNGGIGKNGADAALVPDSNGAANLGSVTSAGFAPASGTNGNSGGPGQGGGGGAADDNGGGGGGGAGGCGGAGGPAGGGGGASIALLSFESTVTISASELTTSDAGDGGQGVDGQAGMTTGGDPGDGALGACDGGKGGAGAKGGAGGGGAGGISAGIVHSGAAPTADPATTFTKGAAGEAGVGGKPGVNDGVIGVSENIVAL